MMEGKTAAKASPKRSRRWKRFTHAQIRAKVEQRRDLKSYHSLLMESAVEKDERGIVFDSHHKSWKKLLGLVQSQGTESQRKFALELKKANPDLYVIRQYCKRHGVPKESRGRVWTLLLEEAAQQSHCGKPKGDFSKLLPTGDSGLRVIKADVNRTFPYNELFQRPEVQRELEVQLSTYCREYGVQYKQGMNFIFAIFFQIGLPDRKSRYHSACLFMETMTGQTFKDRDFGSLQSMFRVFRLLLRYHDPVLCNFMDQNEMLPELYASSWFITLHANRLPVDTLLRLWDYLLVDRIEQRLLHLFVSLGLLIKRRDLILQEGVVTLPEVLSKLSIQSLQEVEELVGQACRRFRPDTPLSVCQKLLSVASLPSNISSPEYQRLESMHCLTVSAEEVVASCYNSKYKGKSPHVSERKTISPMNSSTSAVSNSDLSKNSPSTTRSPASTTFRFSSSGIKYFVLDCRPKKEYDAGHLACAYHIDPSLLFDPERLNTSVQALAAMKGCHFCLCSGGSITPGRNDFPCTMLILYLLQHGFKFISRLEGGYAACHAVIERQARRNRSKSGSRSGWSDPFEILVDHDPTKCIECLKAKDRRKSKGISTSSRTVARPLLGRLQLRLTDMLFGPSIEPMTKQLSKSSFVSGKDGTEGTQNASSEGKSRRITTPDFKVKRAFLSGIRSGHVSILHSRGGRNTHKFPPASVRVLVSTMRKTKTWNPCLQAAMHRIMAKLVDLGIDKAEGLEEGWHSSTKPVVVGAATTESDGILIEHALQAYGRVVRGQLAIFRPGGSVAKDKNKWANHAKNGGFGETLPVRYEDGSSDAGFVLLYVTNGTETSKLMQAINDLAARGFQTCLITLMISRVTIGRLLLKHPKLKVVTLMEHIIDEGSPRLPLLRIQHLLKVLKTDVSATKSKT